MADYSTPFVAGSGKPIELSSNQNPFLMPYVSGVQPVDFKNDFQTNDIFSTDKLGIGVPNTGMFGTGGMIDQWLGNVPGWKMLTGVTDTTSNVLGFITSPVRIVYVILGLVMIIFGVQIIARGNTTMQLVKE